MTDWREKEREFLVGLKADTGRDLAEWMALISGQNLPHRNDVIDWLRRQGFMFSRASWLERIHHNGGLPIYLEPEALALATNTAISGPAAVTDAVVPAPASVLPGAAPPLPAVTGGGQAEPSPAPSEPTIPRPATPALAAARSDAAHFEATGAPPAAPDAGEPPRSGPPDALPHADRPHAIRAAAAPATPSLSPGHAMVTASTPEALAEVLAKGKAYRPLAVHILKTIEVALPELAVSAGASHLVLGAPNAFGLIAISGKDVRLALDLAGAPVAPPFEPVRLPVTSARAVAGLTHMIVLSDARQIDAALIGAIREAARRSEG